MSLRKPLFFALSLQGEGQGEGRAHQKGHVMIQPRLEPKRIVAVPSNTLIVGAYAEAESDDTGNPTKVKEIVVSQTGSYRLRFSVAEKTSGSASYARVYKNGNPIGGTHTAKLNTQYDNMSEDVGPFSVGDLLQLYAWSIAGFKAKVKGLTVSGDLALRPLGITPGTVNLD